MMEAGESVRCALAGPEVRAGRCSRNERGSTILEVLIVAVILLVGIYTVVQLFPVGFDMIDRGRYTTLASAYAHSQLDDLNLDPDGLPAAIIPAVQVKTAVLGSVLPVNLSTRPRELENASSAGGDAGLRDFRNSLVQFRRVMQESTSLPASSSGTARYALRFAPLEYFGSQAPALDLLTLYTLDGYVRVDKSDLDNHKGQDRYYAVDVQGGTASLWFSGYAANDRTFKVDYLVLGPNGTEQVIDALVKVPKTADGSMTEAEAYPGGGSFQMGGSTQTFVAGSENVRHRLRNKVDESGVDDPCAYTLIDPTIGLLEFDLNGSTSGKRVAADYSVMDWQVLHDDIEVPVEPDPGQTSIPAAEQLAWVKVSFPFIDRAPMAPQDSRPGLGMPILIQNIDRNHPGYGTLVDADNASNTWTFADPVRGDQSRAGRVGIRLANLTISGLPIRKVRLYYRTIDGFAAPVVKPCAWYQQAPSGLTTPGFNSFVVNAATNQLRFALLDTGKVVAIDYSYDDGGLVRKVVGEMHTIDDDGYVTLKNVPGNNTIHSIDAVRGMSLDIPMAWAIKGTPCRMSDILTAAWTTADVINYWDDKRGRLQVITASVAVSGAQSN